MNPSEAGPLLRAFAEFFPGAQKIGSYVGGRLVPGEGDEIQLFDPATGETSLSYRDGGAAIARQACVAAQAAQKTTRCR
jgi:aldehyde dehydrogenase (NAD+)